MDGMGAVSSSGLLWMSATWFVVAVILFLVWVVFFGD